MRKWWGNIFLALYQSLLFDVSLGYNGRNKKYDNVRLVSMELLVTVTMLKPHLNGEIRSRCATCKDLCRG